MLKIYTAPGACSLAVDIIAEEVGVPFERKVVQFEEGYLESPAFRKLNPNGAVPTIEIEPGVALTEGVAILQYFAAQKPEANFFPVKGVEHFRAVEWLNFISTELHSKTFGNLWAGEYLVPEKKAQMVFDANVREALKEKLQIVDHRLQGKTYCLGNQYSIVDAYLFTILSWSKTLHVDLTPYKNVTGFQNRMFERPATQRAMKAVGLIK